MTVYEVSNPSDPITLVADSDAVAACAGLLLGRGSYGIHRLPDHETVGGFKEWCETAQFDAGDVGARWRDVAACLRGAAIGNPPDEIRRDQAQLATWNEKKRSSMNDITASARSLADWLEREYGVEPAPFAEVHPRTETRDRAVAALRDQNLARMTLPALYSSTGRYMPEAAKNAWGLRFGFCDEAGKLVPKVNATHVGWSLVP